MKNNNKQSKELPLSQNQKMPQYAARVLAHMAKHVRTSGVFEVTILHDDWCDIFTGGSCNCDFEITEKRPNESR